MRIFSLSLFLFLASNLVHAQSLPATRSTDWTLAGLRDTTPINNVVVFNGVADGITDNSSVFATFYSNLTLPAIIQFNEGNYLFTDEIQLESNTIIRGMGAGVTTFTFDLGGLSKDCFQASGSVEVGNHTLTADVAKDQTVIPVNNTTNISVGDFVRMIQDDADFITDNWANHRTGQISQVVAVSSTSVTLASPLRMDFETTRNAYFKKILPKKNIGLECFTLNRLDQVTVPAERNKTSKIRFSRAVNCWVKGVESNNCNYAHFEALYSANLLVSGCYFHDAFEKGDGGRAYGVMLHYATSESKIENSIFKNLRHSMIVQAGANGNVFAYNYSRDAEKTWFGFTIDSEDMMCHGNYPYLNLFESNVCEYPKVDASHGTNGPFNTFFRNRSTISDFTVSNVSGGGNDNQNFLGNEGSNSFSATGHQETLNSWNGTTGTLETSLAYSTKPDFLTTAEFGAVGYPNFGNSAVNPAFVRYQSGDLINAFCGNYTWNGTGWEDGYVPNDAPSNYKLFIKEGNLCALTADAHLYKVEIEPGGRLTVDNSASFTVQDSMQLRAEPGKYAQFLADAAVPATFEIVLENEGWHNIASPMSSGTVAQLETDLEIKYYGNVDNPSLYTWSPHGEAHFEAVTNNTTSLAGKAFNLYVSDFMVKSGKGVNGDGKLPVKIAFKGTLNNGQIINSALGDGTINAAVAATGDRTGWNFMVNPYPSTIDLDVVFASLPTGFEAGAHIYNPSNSAYELRTTTAIANGKPTHIGPGQAFFVKLNSGANTSSTVYDFDNLVRTVNFSPPFLKQTLEGFTLRLSDEEMNSESIRLIELPTASGNYSAETDISRFVLNDNPIAFTVTKMDGEEKRHLSVAAFSDNEKIIPLEISCDKAGYFSFSITDEIMNGREVFVEDIQQKTFIDVKKHNELFLPQGNFHNRFFLHFLPSGTSIEDVNRQVIFNTNMLTLMFATANPEIAHVTLYDANGRLVFQSPEFYAEGQKSWSFSNLNAGVYVLQVFEGDAVRTEKLILVH